MDKLYTIIGIATFWGIFVGIVFGIIVAVYEEIQACFEVRRQIKHEIKTGKYYTTNHGKGWFATNVTLPDYDYCAEIKWNDFYNFNLWMRIWMIGL